MKKIRELRYGEPKTWKTKSVVETYPKPMAVFNWEPGGLDSVDLPMAQVTSELYRKGILEKDKKGVWADINWIDYTVGRANRVSESAFRGVDRGPMKDFVQDLNCLFDFNPFTTVVVDPFSALSDSVLEYELALNGKDRPSQDIWTLTGAKCAEIASSLFSLDCNVVIISHCFTNKDEQTGTITIQPQTVGQARTILARTAAQVLYSFVETGQDGKAKGRIATCPRGLVTIAGMKFPQNRPAICGPTFQDLYGDLKP